MSQANIDFWIPVLIATSYIILQVAGKHIRYFLKRSFWARQGVG